MRARNVLLLGSMLLMLGGIGLATGCASDRAATAHHEGHGVYCPKCETVWLNEKTASNPRIVSYSSKRAMVCPDCDAQATAALTGEGEVVLHDCDMCKVKPVMVEREFRPAPSNRPK